MMTWLAILRKTSTNRIIPDLVNVHCVTSDQSLLMVRKINTTNNKIIHPSSRITILELDVNVFSQFLVTSALDNQVIPKMKLTDSEN